MDLSVLSSYRMFTVLCTLDVATQRAPAPRVQLQHMCYMCGSPAARFQAGTGHNVAL